MLVKMTLFDFFFLDVSSREMLVEMDHLDL